MSTECNYNNNHEESQPELAGLTSNIVIDSALTSPHINDDIFESPFDPIEEGKGSNAQLNDPIVEKTCIPEIRRARSGIGQLKRPTLIKRCDENVENCNASVEGDTTHTSQSNISSDSVNNGHGEEVGTADSDTKEETTSTVPNPTLKKSMDAGVKKKNKRDWFSTVSVFKFNTDLSESEYEDKMLKYFTYDPKDSYFSTVDMFPPLNVQRDRIANEIMTSEESYNIFMKILVKNWRDPLIAASRDQAISVPESTVQKMFGMIDTILGISDFMLKDFRDRLTAWSPEQIIGDIFLKYGDMLKSYTVYSKERHSSKKIYDECLTRSSFQQFIKVCQKQPLNNNRFLLDYMIMPVQRVPRYELLIADLLKNTSIDHPDRPHLEKAFEKIKTIAEHIDQSVEEYKNYEAIMQIQKKFSGKVNLLQPGRRFIKEGILIKTCRKTKKPRMFWLFSDLLVYAIPQVANIYTLRYQIPMYSTLLEDVPDDEKKGTKFAFLIKSKLKSFQVTATSQVEKVEWLIALNQCSQESLQKHVSIVRTTEETDLEGQAPVWAPDESAQFCELCSCEFNFIVRRHHCRQCGKLVCATCSSWRVYIPHLKKDNARVCDVCYKIHDFPSKKDRKTVTKRSVSRESDNSIETTPRDNSIDISIEKDKVPLHDVQSISNLDVSQKDGTPVNEEMIEQRDSAHRLDMDANSKEITPLNEGDECDSSLIANNQDLSPENSV